MMDEVKSLLQFAFQTSNALDHTRFCTGIGGHGLMGFSSHKKNVLFCLSAIAFALSGSGSPADADKAVTAAQSIYSAK